MMSSLQTFNFKHAHFIVQLHLKNKVYKQYLLPRLNGEMSFHRHCRQIRHFRRIRHFRIPPLFLAVSNLRLNGEMSSNRHFRQIRHFFFRLFPNTNLLLLAVSNLRLYGEMSSNRHFRQIRHFISKSRLTKGSKIA